MAAITQAYNQAFEGKAARWRREIQEHCARVIEQMKGDHGDGPDADWPRLSIARCIENELRDRAPTDVHEAWLDQHPARKSKKAAPWSKFEGQPEADPDDDPVWNIPGGVLARQEPEDQADLETLGDVARVKQQPQGKGRASRKAKPDKPFLRSDWLEFWRGGAKSCAQAFDFSALERAVAQQGPQARTMSADQWWPWWQDVFVQAMGYDPRLAWLWRWAMQRREAGRVMGQPWTAGLGNRHEGEQAVITLLDGARGAAIYRRTWVEHISNIMADEHTDPRLETMDIEKLALAMDPARDQLLDWSGWSHLLASDCLWPVCARVWKAAVAMPHPDARELPQWAWMRTAMALSAQEENPTQKAIDLYDYISSLLVVPSETLVREAGKARPSFCEDVALVVRDDFSDIQDNIHRAAVATKWTGTVSMEWGRVRAQGSPIAGRRISQGVVGFLRAIDMALMAQGREGDDRPVTVTLPLWHRDLEAFFDLQAREAARLQVVVRIPDLFFHRLKDGLSWTLLDPGMFPEVLDDRHFEEAYLSAEKRLRAALRDNPNCAKTMPAEKLWNRIVSAARGGSPFVSFDGPAMADDRPENTIVVRGVDGVGAFPIDGRGDLDISWPSGVVNLARLLDKDGVPDPARMQAAAGACARMLDNARMLDGGKQSMSDKLYHPVCMGLVGYYEAIERAMDTMRDDPALVDAWVSRLSRTWAAVVARADEGLARERGVLPAMEEGMMDAFDPAQRRERMALSRHGMAAPGGFGEQAGIAQTAHRFGARTIWAPFVGPARVAGATPGGIGTLRPIDILRDEDGRQVMAPSAFLLYLASNNPDDIRELREIYRNPDKPGRWPEQAQRLAVPDMQGWHQRLAQAALIAPWLDGGVSVTVSAGLPHQDLSALLQKAWWLGLSNVRFDGSGVD